MEADPDERSPDERTRSSDRGLHRLVRENAYRDLWLIIITLLVLVTLQGFGPLGIKGVDDIAREGADTAQKAQDAADRATRLAKQNADLIAENKITKTEIAKIAREQAKPSVEQVLRLIAKATQVCTQNPAACRRITAPGASSGTNSTSSSPTNTPASSPTRRSGSRSPPTSNGGHQRPPSSGGGGTAPPPPPAPGHQGPPPTVAVTPPVPLPHPICADNIVHIGKCP